MAPPRVSLQHYLDQRCNDIQRELSQLQAEIDRRAGGLQAEIDGREGLMQNELDRRIESLAEQARQALAALDHRLDGMNEFREALRDQANKNVSTELFSSTVMGIDSKLDALTTRLDRTEGSRAGSAENAAAASRGVNQRIAVMALGISVVVILVNVVIALIAHHV